MYTYARMLQWSPKLHTRDFVLIITEQFTLANRLEMKVKLHVARLSFTTKHNQHPTFVPLPFHGILNKHSFFSHLFNTYYLTVVSSNLLHAQLCSLELPFTGSLYHIIPLGTFDPAPTHKMLHSFPLYETILDLPHSYETIPETTPHHYDYISHRWRKGYQSGEALCCARPLLTQNTHKTVCS